MSKIRPKRILEAVLSKKTDISEERTAVCESCEFRTQVPIILSQCKICHCFLSEKPKGKTEHCPKNKWKDIKKMEKTGIKVGLVNPTNLKLEEEDLGVVITFLEKQRKNTPAIVEVRIVNDRAGTMGQFNPETFDLTHLQIKTSCGCTTVKNYPLELKEGGDFTFKIEYDSKNVGKFEKEAKVYSKQVSFYLKIKGEVI